MRGHEADVMCVVSPCSVLSCPMALMRLYGVNWILNNVKTIKLILLSEALNMDRSGEKRGGGGALLERGCLQRATETATPVISLIFLSRSFDFNFKILSSPRCVCDFLLLRI